MNKFCHSFRTYLLLFTILLSIGITRAQELRWRVLTNAPVEGSRHEDVFFISPLRGWIVNLSGEIYRTTDGGENWQLQFFDEQVNFRSIGFADSLRGWAGTLDPGNPLYETFDGGVNWSKVQIFTFPRPEGICGISIANESVVYAAGTYALTSPLLKSINRGMTWIAIDLSAYMKTMVDCYFFSPDSGFVVGGMAGQDDPSLELVRAIILFTADGGRTWETRYQSALWGTWCWKISFPSPTTGYVSVESYPREQGFILKTSDGGLTWEQKGVGELTDLQGIGFATETLGWVGSHTGSYITNDGGETWQEFDFWLDNDSVNRIRMLSDSLGYAVGETVFKYSRGSLTAISYEESKIFQYTLRQNYPNPFNPSTIISYSLAKADFVVLKIYDMLGRDILTLVNEFQKAGTYSMNFDAANLSSGIYFYTLEASAGFRETKKMLLMR